MNQVWSYKSRIGTFYIVPHEGRFHLKFNDELIDWYRKPEQAADCIASGAVPSFDDKNGNTIYNSSELGISPDLSEWQVSFR